MNTKITCLRFFGEFFCLFKDKNHIKNKIKHAFSLIELMISLITISLITAALAPVITKKLSAGTITVGSFGGSSGIIETNTAPQSQKDCNTVGAQLVYVETDSTQKTGLCVTQYNIGDGNFSIPTGSIDENIEAGTAKADGYCSDKKCCWHGATSGTNCDSVNGSYSGCNRTVCNWEAANSICDNLSYGGYSNWRLPTKEELEKMNPDTYSKIGSEHAGDGGLMFCDYSADKNSARCSHTVVCPGSDDGYCSPHGVLSGTFDGSTGAFLRYLDSGSWYSGSHNRTHPFSVRCVLGAITVKTVSDTACSNGSFLNDDSACVSCTIHSPKCTSCTKDFCTACSDGWKVTASGGCEDPNKKSCTLVFGEAGDKQFTIPSDVDSMEVTLVSGGNGGNGGDGTLMTHTFVTTGTGNSANNDDNLLTVKSSGKITYFFPEYLKNKYALLTSCGGGGASGGRSSDNQYDPNSIDHDGGTGGRGGYVVDKLFIMPNASSLNVWIGLPGSNSANNGSDPIYGQSNIGGASAGNIYNGDHSTGNKGTNGSYVYGGLSGAKNYSGGTGGRGGGATLMQIGDYAKNSTYVAGGGGGGGGGGAGRLCDVTGSSGGGGGGVTGGKGGNGGNGCANGASGNSGTNSQSSTIFGSSYCNANTPGAMRITYVGAGTTSTGGTGGGTGAIVPMQTVDLTTNDYISAGETLKIHIGAGGAGGSAPTGIASDGSYSITAGAGSQGEETYIANNSNVKILATKGIQSGSSAGYITNGKNTTQISVENFSSSDGSANNNKAGGNGGTIILNGEEFIGGTGATTAANGASASTGNYGAGGGGGYSSYSGGNGADGYAKIKFMSSSAGCTAAKAEIAYNGFMENKNNIFMKIKLALIQFKDFILAKFNPKTECKICKK